jgi:hypothetical protein
LQEYVLKVAQFNKNIKENFTIRGWIQDQRSGKNSFGSGSTTLISNKIIPINAFDL